MKKLFSCILALVPGILFIGEGGAVSVSVTSARNGNIFNRGEAVTLTISARDIPAEQSGLSLRYQVTDYYGASLKAERAAVKPDGSGVFERTIEVRPARKGIFYVSCELLSGETILAGKTVTFGVISPVTPDGSGADSPFGICSWFDWDDELLDLYEKIGIKWIRMDWPWNFAENEGKGRYVWTHFDDFVARAKRHRLRILACVVSYPQWANGTGYLNTPPRNLQDFADFVAVSVRRYKDEVKNWELLNEANLTDFWNGPAESYTEMLKLSYRAAKKEDPDCVIHLGSLSMPVQLSVLNSQRDDDYDIWNPFLEAVLKNGGGEYFDAFGIHTGNDPAGATEGARIGRTLKKHGYDKPAWMTEMANYPTGPATKADAELRTKLTVIFLGEGIRKVFWFLGRDTPSDDSGANLNYIGMVYRDLTPKPAYLSYAALISELSDARPVSRLKLGEGFSGYYFEKNGRPISVLWSNKGARVLSLRVNEDVEVVDIMGNAAVARPKDGVVALDVSESPIYVHVRPGGMLAQPVIKLRPYRANVAEQPAVVVDIANCTSRDLRGEVVVSGPRNWVISPSRASLERVAPGGTTSLKFKVESGDVAPDERYTVTATLRGDKGIVCRSEERIDFLVCSKTPVPPGCDLDAGSFVPGIRLDKAGQVREMKDWRGPADLSALVRLFWDDRFFYLVGRVSDDRFAQNEKPDRTWAGDSVQFGLDPDPELPTGKGRVFTLALTPSGPQLWENFADQAFGAPQGRMVKDAKVAARRIAGGWIFEAAVPFADLSLKPVPGKLVGFSLLVNDNDGSGRRGWLEWAGGIGYGEGSRLYGNLSFVE